MQCKCKRGKFIGKIAFLSSNEMVSGLPRKKGSCFMHRTITHYQSEVSRRKKKSQNFSEKLAVLILMSVITWFCKHIWGRRFYSGLNRSSHHYRTGGSHSYQWKSRSPKSHCGCPATDRKGSPMQSPWQENSILWNKKIHSQIQSLRFFF